MIARESKLAFSKRSSADYYGAGSLPTFLSLGSSGEGAAVKIYVRRGLVERERPAFDSHVAPRFRRAIAEAIRRIRWKKGLEVVKLSRPFRTCTHQMAPAYCGVPRSEAGRG